MNSTALKYAVNKVNITLYLKSPLHIGHMDELMAISFRIFFNINHRDKFVMYSYFLNHIFFYFLKTQRNNFAETLGKVNLCKPHMHFQEEVYKVDLLEIQCIIHNPCSTCHKVALAKPTTRPNLKHFTVN